VDSSEIGARIATYFGKMSAENNHRYRSWEHCYHFFRERQRSELLCDLDVAALQLGFYLASWGMYRGSSFLLQHDYTVHKPTVEAILSDRFAPLWEQDIGADARDDEYAPLIFEAAQTVKASYRPIGDASDTLVTKVLLGTLACLPACDRFFIAGFKHSGQPYSYLNSAFIRRMIGFCTKYLDELHYEQPSIGAASGAHYPLMKLADMYFWQIGFEAAGEPALVEG